MESSSIDVKFRLKPDVDAIFIIIPSKSRVTRLRNPDWSKFGAYVPV